MLSGLIARSADLQVEEPKGRQYMTFLSHYKAECGSDARYLKDLLQRMSAAEVFLDSSNLADLSVLFSHGVQQADCLLLLCSTKVLSRPWCLLELFEAQQSGIPIVQLLVSKHAFPSAAALRSYLLDLEDELEARSPGATRTITTYLRERGVSFATFKTSLLQALVLDGRSTSAHARRTKSLMWHPWGSDNQVIADAMDVLNAMAAATGQTLSWPVAAASLLPSDGATAAAAAPTPSASQIDHKSKFAVFISTTAQRRGRTPHITRGTRATTGRAVLP